MANTGLLVGRLVGVGRRQERKQKKQVMENLAKKEYTLMKVAQVGEISNIVAKSENYSDLSQNVETKTFDAGDGQESQQF